MKVNVGVFPDLSCVSVGCKERATHVVVQTSDLALLFQDMAGVTCEYHAQAMERVGGVALSFTAYGEAARKEHEE